MKKALSMLLAIVMVFSLLPMAVFAATIPTVYFETDFSADMGVGDTFTVKCMLKDNEEFGGFTLSLKWNEDVVKFTGFDVNKRGALISDVFIYNTPIFNPELGIVVANDIYGHDTNGMMFIANFEIIGSGDLDIGLKTADRTEYEFIDVYGEVMDSIIDTSALDGLAVAGSGNAGAAIPEGAPFTAITTDAGDVIGIQEMDDVNYKGYSTYNGVPYYHVQIPEGAEEVYVTHPFSADPFCDASYNSAYGYYADTETWSGGGINLAFENAAGGYTITMPLTAAINDWMYGEVELSFVADEDGYVSHAVAVEANSFDPICFFTFEYAEAAQGGEEEIPTYSITVDQPTGGSIAAYDVNGNAITEAPAGEYVLVDVKADTGYRFSYVTIDGEGIYLENGFFQMPAHDVVISAVFEKVHTCVYDQKVEAENFLKDFGDCQNGAVYYMSCTCGLTNVNVAQTFVSNTMGDHVFKGGVCDVCGCLNATNLTWWYGNSSTTEITIQEGDVVDAVAGCTPKASGTIGFSSADSTIASVSTDEATTDKNGHAAVQITGNTIGKTIITVFSKIDSSKKAELTVDVSCGHKNTETHTTYTQVEDTENHTATTTCACGEVISTATGSCMDENTDGKCDLCGGAVEIPEVSGPTCIFDSSIHGTWGSPITFKKLYIDGVTVKSYEWVNGACVVTLAADTAKDAAITFSVEGLSGGGGAACLYINNSKSNYTINLVDGEASVEVKAASKYTSGSMATAKTVSFMLEGQQTVPVESITIIPENPVVKAGGTLQLTANVYPENATVKDVVWTTSAPDTAITLTETGKVLGQTMGMGQYYTITATSKSNPEVTATCQVYLDYKTETGITISAETMNLKVGETGNLSATVEGDQFSSNKTVTWSSSDDTVATVANGKVTAVGAGKATITATSYSGLTASCEVTVEAVAAPGYHFATSADVTAENGGTSIVYVKVTGNSDPSITGYNAYDITLTFDDEKLEYVGYEGAVKDDNGVVVVNGNEIRIVGCGADKDFGTEIAALTFQSKAEGAAEVTVTKAQVSNKNVAVNENIPEATPDVDTDETPDITVVVVPYTVTKPGFISGNDKVLHGEDYTFSYTDTTNYTYADLKVTVGGVEVVPTEENGVYTIENVTGTVEITATQTANSYNVTKPENVEGLDQATYGEDYIFTVTPGDGMAIESVTVTDNDGNEIDFTINENGEYVIPGNAITGELTITVTEKENRTTITFSGVEESEVEGGLTQTAKIGKDFTFKLNKEEGWGYIVKVGETELTEKNGSYTIPAELVVEGGVLVTIEKVDITTASIDVAEYINLDGKTMFLVTAKWGENVLAIGEETMFWSDRYTVTGEEEAGAYCWLVLSTDEMNTADQVMAYAETAIVKAAEDAQATAIRYDCDVNATTKVDVNDAQLVYDMYNASYMDFTEDLPMLKFLEADMATDAKLDTKDVAAIINYIVSGANA